MEAEKDKDKKAFFDSTQKKVKEITKLTPDEEKALIKYFPELSTNYFKGDSHEKISSELENSQRARLQVIKHRPSFIEALIERYLPKRAEIEKINFEENPLMIDPSLLSPNELHPRFRPKHGSQSLCFLKSQLYNDIKERFEVVKSRDVFSDGYLSFLHGEAGIGKSFSLALNILEKRKYWKECPYLILYIHYQDRNSYKRVFQELLYSLCFVEMTKKQEDDLSKVLIEEFEVNQNQTIEEQIVSIYLKCQCRFLNANSFRRLLRIMVTLRKHILLAIDHAPVNSHQGIKALSKVTHNIMIENPGGCSLFLFSSQPPPKVYALDESFQKDIEETSGKFSEEEARRYLRENINPIFWSRDSQFPSKPIDKILSVAQNIPYELSRLCDSSFVDGNDSEEKVVIHSEKVRKAELAKSYSQIND